MMRHVRIGLAAIVVGVARVAEACKLYDWCKQSLLMLYFNSYSLVFSYIKAV